MKNMKILIVEDSLTQAEKLKYILENNEYIVKHAADAKEAMNLLKKNIPNVIISDIVMPGKSGYDLCKEIKSDNSLKDLPVILLTSLSDPVDIIKGLDCGADTFITKPYSEEFLLSKIEYLIMNFRMRKHQSTDVGLEVFFSGKKYLITSSRLQIVDLLFSTYENAVLQSNELKEANDELKTIQSELSKLNKNLERKVVERTQNIKDINAVLRAIRNINQLTIKEKDRHKLIKEACNIITQTNVFHNAWIALTDKEGKIIDFVDDGIKRNVSDFSVTDFKDYVPNCIERSLNADDVILIESPRTECEGCPRYQPGQEIESVELAMCLKSKNRRFGVIMVSLPAQIVENSEQQHLFKEIAEDIAFALNNIDLEEQRKLAEERQAFTARILSILNRKNEWQRLIKDILSELKEFTGLEAIGIRMQDGEDYPYYDTTGYTSDFVKADNFLCEKGKNNETARDVERQAILKCLCGKIITEGINNNKPFYTQIGSFWTNNYSRLFSEGLNEDLNVPANNLCQKKGYESIALIPLRSGKKTIGLLQFHDKRTNKFNLEMINFFEEIGSTIGIAYKRMQTEILLKENEQRFRSSLQNSKTTVSNQDLELKYSWMYNSYLKIDDKQIIGKRDSDIFDKEDANTLYQLKQSVLRIKERVNKVIKLKVGNKVMYKDITCEPIFKDGELVGISSISTDITELEKAKQKAEESDKLKSAFLANVSHEIRTPLNGIIGFSKLLVVSELTKEKEESYINIINGSCHQLLRIIDDILDISRIETGQFEIQKENFYLNDILKLTCNEFEPKCMEKGLKLTLHNDLKENMQFINTDKVKLSQIINNLVNNAIKFSKDGDIVISCNMKSGYLEFCVKDNGIGISKENQERIFDRFWQVESDLTRTYGGTGLGLSIVKAYVEALGGSVWIHSELNKGTEIYFKLPHLLEEISKPDFIEDKNTVNLNDDFKDKVVLTAEDEDMNYEYLYEILKQKEMRVIRAKNGRDAVEMCETNDIDMVLMDIKMPVMDGFTATKEIKLKHPEIPVIAQTAFALVGDEEKVLAAGCDDYIAKPIIYDELVNMIDNYIKKNK